MAERHGDAQKTVVPIGFSSFEKSLLAEARDRGERMYRLVCDIDPAAPMKFAKAYLVLNNLEQLVTVIRVDPPWKGKPRSTGWISALRQMSTRRPSTAP
jgi:hypothetical protein